MLENMTPGQFADLLKKTFKSALYEHEAEKKTYLRNYQNKYSLVSLYCTPFPKQQVFVDGVLQPSVKPLNGLYLECNRPFIILDTVVVNNQIVVKDFLRDMDRDSNSIPGVRFNNHLCYMRVTPGATVASWADMNWFHSTAGIHVVPDYRRKMDDTEMKEEVQICFVLKLNDNVGENGY